MRLIAGRVIKQSFQGILGDTREESCLIRHISHAKNHRLKDEED